MINKIKITAALHVKRGRDELSLRQCIKQQSNFQYSLVLGALASHSRKKERKQVGACHACPISVENRASSAFENGSLSSLTPRPTANTLSIMHY